MVYSEVWGRYPILHREEHLVVVQGITGYAIINPRSGGVLAHSIPFLERAIMVAREKVGWKHGKRGCII